MRAIPGIVEGIVLVVLGSLWILQGADLMRIQSILCFADCEPLAGGSIVWLAAGLVALAVGLFLLLPAPLPQVTGSTALRRAPARSQCRAVAGNFS
jgi:hypothetical protein